MEKENKDLEQKNEISLEENETIEVCLQGLCILLSAKTNEEAIHRCLAGCFSIQRTKPKEQDRI